MMDRRQIAALHVLEELGVKPNMRSFKDRLIVQKVIYLAQAAGVDLGYYYGWYLRGPYCSDVARDLFAAVDDPSGVDEALQEWALDRETQDRLSAVRSLIKSKSNRAKWTELLASVHYLVDRRQVERHGAREITARLRAYNKDYRQEEVQEALDALKETAVTQRA